MPQNLHTRIHRLLGANVSQVYDSQFRSGRFCHSLAEISADLACTAGLSGPGLSHLLNEEGGAEQSNGHNVTKLSTRFLHHLPNCIS